jgi:hypothetical protein
LFRNPPSDDLETSSPKGSASGPPTSIVSIGPDEFSVAAARLAAGLDSAMPHARMMTRTPRALPKIHI